MYTSHKQIVTMSQLPIAAQTPAVKATLYPGLQKMVVRSVAFTITVAQTVTASVWSLRKRPTPGSSSGETVIATITLPTTDAIGVVRYRKGLNVELVPGDELALTLDTAATAGSAAVAVELDPVPEHSANLGAEVLVSA